MWYHTLDCFNICSLLSFLLTLTNKLSSTLSSCVIPSLLLFRTFWFFKTLSCGCHCINARDVWTSTMHWWLFIILYSDEWWFWAVFLLFYWRKQVRYSLFKARSISIIWVIMLLYKLRYYFIIDLRFFFTEYLLLNVEMVLDWRLERDELLLEKLVPERKTFLLFTHSFLMLPDFFCKLLQFIMKLFILLTVLRLVE